MWNQESLTTCLSACLYVCVCECVFTCVLIAVADMASCLVRLITPLSAALGSMCWWIPQQRSSWPGTLHGQWLITDTVSFWLCHNKEKGKDGDSLCMFFVWAWFKTEKNLNYKLYRLCEQSLALKKKAAMDRPGFQRGKIYVYSIYSMLRFLT